MNRSLVYWLYLCCFMVFAMAVIGAVTRLTESGLSITEWRPVTGALPPLTHAEWQRQFDLYRQSPEFAQKHFWMELGDFQKIFFWEWLHRLWGRTIGIIYVLPLLWFWIRKRIPEGYGGKFLGILALGGLQGAVGWWMVASGLVDRPSVSHFRLAAHLALALIIFSALWWTALDLKRPSPLTSPLPFTGWGKQGGGLACLFLLSLTIIWGAFTAGLDAGMAYNTFPLMNGSLTPPESFDTDSVVSQAAWVQFTHRWLATGTGVSILMLSWLTKDKWLGAMVLVQITLGISTLLTQVYIPLAAAHQGGAIILLALLLKNIRDGKITRKEDSKPGLSANGLPP